jgi:hypothetical protein
MSDELQEGAKCRFGEKLDFLICFQRKRQRIADLFFDFFTEFDLAAQK